MFMNEMNAGNASDSIIRNVLYVKTGQHMTRSNMNYLKQTINKCMDNDTKIRAQNIFPSDHMILKAKTKLRLQGHFPRSSASNITHN